MGEWSNSRPKGTLGTGPKSGKAIIVFGTEDQVCPEGTKGRKGHSLPGEGQLG